MTSRRDFLKAAAIAPVAAPALVRGASDLQGEYAAVGYVTGHADWLSGSGYSLPDMRGRTFARISGVPWGNIDPPTSVTLSIDDLPPTVPNRLLGAYINEDGDAV
jgi:hypothetical protein